MHKAWWRGDIEPPFPLPGTIEGKDAPIWSGKGCELQSTGQVGSTDFKWSDYWEVTLLSLNWHFCLSLTSNLTEASRGAESILLWLQEKTCGSLGRNTFSSKGFAAVVGIIALKEPGWREWYFHFLFGCLMLYNRHLMHICPWSEAGCCGASSWIIFTAPRFLMPHSWEIMRKLVPGLHFLIH